MNRTSTLGLIKFFSFLFLFSFSIFCQAQGICTLSGVTKDAETEEPLIGARVFLLNTKYGAMANEEGKYVIKSIPPGTYTLVFNYFGYLNDTIRGINLKEGDHLTFDRKMNIEISELDVIIIEVEKNRGSDVNGIEEKKNITQVSEVIGSVEIGRTAARTTADVAGRVPGVTITDGRFVIVRGLSQRYNAVLLNNALAPSSETDVKAFSFDIIPSSMVDRMVIYKTAAPELPGEFAGAVIKVYTKTIPDRNSFSIGYASGIRQYTTFKDFSEQKQGKNAWLGFDDGTYKLPKDLPDNLLGINAAKSVEYNQLLRNDVWRPSAKQAPVDHRFNLNFSGKIDLGKKARLGTVTIANYSNTYSNILVSRAGYNDYNFENDRPDSTYSNKDQQYTHAVNLGILHNWGLKINDNHRIEFKNLFNQLGSSQYIFREEQHYADGFYREDYMLRNLYRTMYSGQLTGNHQFNSIRTKFEWAGGYSKAVRSEPDLRRYRQQRDIANPSAKMTTVIQNFPNPYYLGRLFGNTDENIWMTSGNFEHELKFSIADTLKPIVKAGYYIENKDREFWVRNLGYKANGVNAAYLKNLSLDELFTDPNFNATNRLLIAEITDPKFSYTAGNKLFAYYLGVDVPLSRKLKIYPGLRIENNTQSLSSYDESGNPIILDNHIVSYLPSANITYSFNPDTSLIRMAYGKTLNRPEFRELAPLAYYDFYLNITQSGNPNLKTPEIHNFDLRYEYYPRKGETYSIGMFYKRFINPIETYFIVSSNPNYTYGNADFARSIGVEVEVKKSFMDVFKDFKLLNNFSVALNGAYIDSKINLGDVAAQTQERPMQGQSPYIVNAAIYYNNDSLNFQVNVIYNIIGRRIFLVGNNVGFPDVYEMSRNLLDITFTKGIGRYIEVRGTVQNLLNTRFQFLQDSNKDGKFERDTKNDQQIIGYRTGRYFTLGATLKF